MNRNTGMNARQIIGTMNGQQVVGLDIAKQVFQMHTVNMGTGEIVNVPIKRAKVLEHFANRLACLIAIEACGGAHHCPLCQTSCRLHRTKNPGAAMKDGNGTIRTDIQGPGGCPVAAA